MFCFIGLQVSYLTWGYVQEKVMTTEYTTGKFPSATFCVFSNRVLAVKVSVRRQFESMWCRLLNCERVGGDWSRAWRRYLQRSRVFR